MGRGPRRGGVVRVLMVTPRFHPHRGGVESHTWEVARRLVRDPEVEVAVLTTDPEERLPSREVIDGIPVHRVPAWPPGADLYISPAVYRVVRAAPVDLVHCQGYHTFVAPLAMAAARHAGLPYVLTFHSGGHSSRLRTAVRPLQSLVLRPLLADASALIAVSRYEASLFGRRLRLPLDRFAVIPNGADLPTEVAGEISDEVGPPEPLIVSIGRLERYKGHQRLIEALPAVRLAHGNVRLLILGDGPYGPKLRRLAKRHGVEGAVEIRSTARQHVRAILQGAAVVALLSEYESQGIAAYEALALGRRLVVSDSTALAELSGLEQVTGVMPHAPPRTVARILVEQLTAPPAGASGLELPSWDACAASVAAVYRSVLGR